MPLKNSGGIVASIFERPNPVINYLDWVHAHLLEPFNQQIAEPWIWESAINIARNYLYNDCHGDTLAFQYLVTDAVNYVMRASSFMLTPIPAKRFCNAIRDSITFSQIHEWQSWLQTNEHRFTLLKWEEILDALAENFVCNTFKSS